QRREKHGDVGRRARVRLHVGVLGREHLPGPLPGEVLDRVHVLAAAVVALAGVALGVLVRQDAAGRLAHGARNVVLRRDQLERLLLATLFGGDDLGDAGIGLGQRSGEKVVHGVPVSSVGAGVPARLRPKRAGTKARSTGPLTGSLFNARGRRYSPTPAASPTSTAPPDSPVTAGSAGSGGAGSVANSSSISVSSA